MKQQRVLIYERTVNRILSLIDAEKMQIGDRLPAERTLATKLGVSRGSLREALHILEVNGYVTIKPNSGIYVNRIPANNSYVDNIEGAKDQIDLNGLKYAMEMRIMVESYGISQAAKTITKKQLEDLYVFEDNLYDEMLTSSEGTNEDASFGRPSLELEHRLIECQPNPLITEAHSQIMKIWSEYMGQINAVSLPAPKRHVDHLRILNAVSKNDPAKINSAVSKHLQDTYANICLLIEEESDVDPSVGLELS